MRHSWIGQGTEELATKLDEAFGVAKQQGKPAFIVANMTAIGDEVKHVFDVLTEKPRGKECLIVHPDDVVDIYGGAQG